ncbi:MAG: bifunctional homocysteine S-methyltransferase/methylenetetrahydrofolate reductase [bacterium]|nr:bifunctional homocysteine S-methyltransferase/methylenetetrahydrofolate reductase [bacterium]
MDAPAFLTRLQQGLMLGDGALGTMFYQRGVFINRCYDELNLSQPADVEEIHRAYIAAGAELIETNTFGANAIALSRHGLAEKMAQINERGAAIARACTDGTAVLVAGSMGPTGLILERDLPQTADRVRDAFLTQAQALVAGGVEVIILETFYSLAELLVALDVIKARVPVPVIAQVTFDAQKQAEYDMAAATPADIARTLADHGADVVGTNCGGGPAALLHIVEEMARATPTPVSVFANAGVPETHGGRLLCLGTSAEYIAEYARRYAQAGARVIGGCCGTTPEMIKEMAKFLKGVTAAQRSRAFVSGAATKAARTPIPLAQRSAFGAKLCDRTRTRPLVSVELSPPLGTDPARLLRGAQLLKEGGVDIVNIPDGPRATPRMSPIASARLIHDTVGLETLVHYCCRDRNLLGMQMDLLGAHALGIHQVMLITGDPPKIGNVQAATPVFDVDAIGLIKMVNDMNHGIGLANTDLGGQTQFVIGAGCNPGAIDLAHEARRFALKVEAGAEFFFCQPVYLPELLDRFLELTTAHSQIPFFVGILPLASLRNAEFLHNEVPGMQIPADIMARLRAARTKEDQQREGICIAQDIVRQALRHPRVAGIYLFPPFGRYESALEVLAALP